MTPMTPAAAPHRPAAVASAGDADAGARPEGPRESARRGALVEGWEALRAAAGATGPVYGPSGHALEARPATAARTSAEQAPEDPAGARVLRSLECAGARWTLLAAPPDVEPAPAGADWLLGVARLRLGVSEWLRDQAVAHLSARTSGGTPLVRMQLVLAALADAAAAHLEAAVLLDVAPLSGAGAAPGGAEAASGPADAPPAVEPGQVRPTGFPGLDHVHHRITRADRELLRLFGASGFLSDGPGQRAHLSELLASMCLEGGNR